MSTTASLFNTSCEKTREWVREFMWLMGWDNERRALAGFRAGLHAIRDRLTIEETVQLSAQMPTLLRGIYFEAWRPRSAPVKIRHVDEILDWVEEELSPNERVDPEAVLSATIGVLKARISEGEVNDIIAIMPRELRTLWE